MFNFHSRKPAKRPHHLRLSPIRQKCQTWTQRNGQSDGVYVKLTARSTQSSPLPGPSVRRLWNTALEVKSRTTPGTTEVTFLLNYQEFAPFLPIKTWTTHRSKLAVAAAFDGCHFWRVFWAAVVGNRSERVQIGGACRN